LRPHSASLIRKRLRMKKLKNRFYRCSFALLGLLVFIPACKKDENPAVATVPATAPKVVQQPAVQKPISSVSNLQPLAVVNQIDFSSKKDPFKPAIVATVVKQTAANNKNGVQGLPILSFDVGQFRLIGIVTGTKENKAMVVDPNGKGYVVKPGMIIGKNEGRVTSVNASGIEILEQFKDDNGRVRKETIKLTLPRKQ
jgi:type IV pilus assembly protein PilP